LVAWDRLLLTLLPTLNKARSIRDTLESIVRKSHREDLIEAAYRRHLKTLTPVIIPLLPSPIQCKEFAPLTTIADTDVVELTDQWHRDLEIAVIEAHTLMLGQLLKHKQHLVSQLSSGDMGHSLRIEDLSEEELDSKLALATTVYGMSEPSWGLEQISRIGDQRVVNHWGRDLSYSHTPPYPFSAPCRAAVLAILLCLGKGPTTTVAELDVAEERLLCLACPSSRTVYTWRAAVSLSCLQRHKID
jgi:hypothetical protein